MNQIQNNLHLYELVLLILGSILFVMVSGAFIYLIIKQRDFKILWAFFGLSLIMIGFPAVKSFEIAGFKADLDRSQKRYAKNPLDSVAKKEVEELTEKLEPRAKTNQDKTRIVSSKLILNKTDEAIKEADNVIGNSNVNKIVESLKLKPTAVSESNKAIVEAYKLKKVAEAQQEAIKKKDTAGLNKKLNAVLSDKTTLLKLQPKELVKVNTTQQIKLKDPKILFSRKQLTPVKLVHPDSLLKNSNR